MKKPRSQIQITTRDVERAAWRAFSGHESKAEVQDFKSDFDSRANQLWMWLKSGEWKTKLNYRKMRKMNKNGKLRDIECPDLKTRIYQHLFILKVLPLYVPLDNGQRKNCKKGFGITATKKSRSVVSRMKHLYYDRRDCEWVAKIDQRKCYMHIRPQVFRKELRNLTTDDWFLDFAVSVCFVNNQLPIGTPSSPVAHHIVMLRFDHFKEQICEYSIGYADDDLLATLTKEEAHAALWRAKFFLWHELGIRLKGCAVVQPITKQIDFCGYKFNRNNDKQINDHNKGYCTVRRSTLDSARKANARSYPSYFGLLHHADMWNELRKIERDMKLQQLTEKIRIDRRLDARNIEMREIAGREITIVDYEIRYDAKGNANWVKCLIGLPEISAEGEPTGRILAREFHGNYAGIYNYLLEVEKSYKKSEIIPIEDAVIVNQCGYIFDGSTNQIQFIN